jgi:16S rRNA (uracil1498-N3)-methyltransferase
LPLSKRLTWHVQRIGIVKDEIMVDRFYCSLMPSGDTALLEGTEAHHLSRVLRKAKGERIEIFDGHGHFAQAEIQAVSKKTVELKILERSFSQKPIGEVVLATAIPKGDRFRWLVEKAVELGVDRLVPLLTERSVVKPGEGKRDKMEQVVIEACKQCRRDYLMEVSDPKTWPVFLKECQSQSAPAFIAHPEGAVLRDVFPSAFPARVVFIVGPEGGFTDEEIHEATRSGATAVGLGPNILRIETAALTLAAFAALRRTTR